MTDVFILMGYSRMKKSATIRALTGAPKKGVFQVAISQGAKINIFVQIRSLQEEKTSPQNFIAKATGNNYQNVLMSLWISQGRGQPNGCTYIQSFLQAGWNIQRLVVLGINSLPYALPTNAPTPLYIPNSQNLPANQIASQIRGRWQWL